MDNQKHLFSLRNDIHYLNCAYKSPLLKSSEERGIRALIRDRNPSDIIADDFFNEAEEVRRKFSQIVNCKPSNVAIIPSVSYGLGSVLKNIKYKSGQHFMAVEDEFPSGYFSIKRWCDDNGAELKIIRPNRDHQQIGKSWNEALLDQINENTAVVAMASIHWMTGLKFDLEKIGKKCQSVGAHFIVDGTQSVGALAIDVKRYHIDALICAGYKWLMGPYSLGAAYVGEKYYNGAPLEETWMNRTNARDFSNLTVYDMNYTPDAGRFNVGESGNFILIPMFNESLRQILSWGIPNIQAYCGKLINPLLAYLERIGAVMEDEKYRTNHLFALKLPAGIDMDLMKENLKKNKIYISVRGEFLRVAVNVFNTKDDIAKLIETIEETKEMSKL